MSFAETIPLLLTIAWLLPLGSFAMIVFFGPRMGKAGKGAALIATGAIVTACVLSWTALGFWLCEYPLGAGHGEAAAAPAALSGEWYSLGDFDTARVSLGYYIDGLTLAMFCMVTLIASCIHVYSIGYMHEELEEVTDPMVALPDGRKLRRRGRFPRFFQYLSLFCFSMLGLVIAGNMAMVFCFWELVGICSYLLIGFYIERRSASTAANKAFIVNRVGDFGMIIGLMILWTGMGTFNFADTINAEGQVIEQGIFSQVRPTGEEARPVVPDGLVRLSAKSEVEKIWRSAPDAQSAQAAVAAKVPTWREQNYGYWLLVVAGLGIFCGCVGKSAQFPLHVWLPDAMEGPTPVSALIHAATMVAAGVYLTGRFFSVFVPEVLLVIAIIGCITLFIAATIALTATDIKRVLAYSTVSQLGYMMLALGCGGWLAGMLHLFTHAFFKSLLFLCSGSVIHACHTNEMPEMGGLRKKMPWTAGTMLVGCLAIAGAGIPLLIGLSGYYSKDFIVAQLLVFKGGNASHAWMFYAAVCGAGLTAFYMFRLWFMTFAGQPRDKHVYDHAHESPWVMVGPLVLLALFAIGAAWSVYGWGLQTLLEQARPVAVHQGVSGGVLLPNLIAPAEHLSHEPQVHVTSTLIAFGVASIGFLLAMMFYGLKKLDPDDVRRQFSPIYKFLVHKWWFDELYDWVFVRPTLTISTAAASLDKRGIDAMVDATARLTLLVAKIDEWFDRVFVDRLVNLTGRWTFAAGLKLRSLQTGNLRQYVMFLAIGTVALFVLMSLYWNNAHAGG